MKTLGVFCAVLPIVALMLPACGSDVKLDFPDNVVDAGPPPDPLPDAEPPPDPDPVHNWTKCQASDQAWVRRAMIALAGRKPWGQAEVNLYSDVIAAIRQVDPETPVPLGEDGKGFVGSLAKSRKVAAEIMMRDPAFRLRWADFFQDALRVVRVETKSFESCYGAPNASVPEDGQLAAWVRDNDPSANNPPMFDFTMRELLDSALVVDDLSPVYRAHLFAMVSRPYEAANVGPNELERARRQNFGAVFERAYLHRDRVCLNCHTSDFSVTSHEDPELNRHWPIPGKFEQALYGSSNATHPPDEAATKGSDELRALSMLRYDGVAAPNNGLAPYGWNGDVCGKFREPTEDDPLGIDTYFASIRSSPFEPTRGLRASVWDLERALHRGVDQLAKNGLTRLPEDVLADPDEGFAYLVAQNIVDQVWAEVMGQRLTIANYFPRTRMQRDILQQLTDHFVAEHFSLRTLLLDIVAHPLFNLKAPEEGCGVSAYEVPRILNPWSNAEQDVNERNNSPGDGVFALSPRFLRRNLHRTLNWPAYPEYPEMGPEEEFQRSIGFFLKDSEPGFRGLDFQGRLSWEEQYGPCKFPSFNDYIKQVVNLGKTQPGTTLGDVIIAVKDRLIGEPWIEPMQEKNLIATLVTGDLDNKQSDFWEVQARAYCGVVLSSPQFMLGGMVPRDVQEIPKLTLPQVSYGSLCSNLVATAKLNNAPYVMNCNGTSITVTK
jgi:hypothetical protein